MDVCECKMSETRTQKSLRNAKWGILLQLVTMLTSFVIRTLFMRCLGVALNGLNGLMLEVVAILSMAEMGFGTAIVYHLYKPLAAGDTDAVNRLMGLYRRSYRGIACVLVGIGLLLMPFVPAIVTGVDFSNGYIRAVFGLFIIQTASSYLFSYKRSLFNADQKNYIVTLFSIVFNVLTAVVAVLTLILSRAYIPFLIAQIAMTLLGNVAISLYADQKYPFLKQKPLPVSQEEKKSVFSSIRHLFVGLVSGKITTSTDNVLISVLVSTYQIGLYSNYSLISNAVTGLFRKVSSGMVGSMGNLYVTASHARAEAAFHRMEFVFGAAGLVASLMMYAVLTPFVRLWLGAQYLLSDGALLVCMINQFLFIAREPLWHMSTASGLFSIDKYVSIFGSVVNLIVSIVLGRIIGMVGIFVGTTCTLVIQIVLKEWFLYKRRLDMNPWKPLAAWGLRCAVLLTGMASIHWLSPLITVESALADLVLKLALSGVLSLAMVLLVFGRTKEFAYFTDMLKSRAKNV